MFMDNNPDANPATWSGVPSGCGMPGYPSSCPYMNPDVSGGAGQSNIKIIQYTIQPGDTLWNLAAQYNTTVEAIMAYNPGIDPNNLMVGQVILIPDPPFGMWGGGMWGGPWFRPWFRPWGPWGPWGPWI